MIPLVMANEQGSAQISNRRRRRSNGSSGERIVVFLLSIGSCAGGVVFQVSWKTLPQRVKAPWEHLERTDRGHVFDSMTSRVVWECCAKRKVDFF